MWKFYFKACFIVGVTKSATIKKGITCYVCKPPQTNNDIEALENLKSLNYNIENIPTCGSNTARNFTLKCPNEYKGCLTKTYGGEFIYYSVI